VSKYRLLLHFDIEARDDAEAVEHAKKIGDTVKNPLVRMSLESDGIKPIGQAVIYAPQRLAT
jgi:hypothetical protein